MEGRLKFVNAKINQSMANFKLFNKSKMLLLFLFLYLLLVQNATTSKTIICRVKLSNWQTLTDFNCRQGCYKHHQISHCFVLSRRLKQGINRNGPTIKLYPTSKCGPQKYFVNPYWMTRCFKRLRKRKLMVKLLVLLWKSRPKHHVLVTFYAAIVVRCKIYIE